MHCVQLWKLSGQCKGCSMVGCRDAPSSRIPSGWEVDPGSLMEAYSLPCGPRPALPVWNPVAAVVALL